MSSDAFAPVDVLVQMRRDPACMAAVLDLEPRAAVVLSEFMKAAPEHVSRAAIEIAVFNGDASDKIVHIHVCRLRGRLREYGVELETKRGAGGGWRLSEDARATLDAILADRWRLRLEGRPWT